MAKRKRNDEDAVQDRAVDETAAPADDPFEDDDDEFQILEIDKVPVSENDDRTPEERASARMRHSDGRRSVMIQDPNGLYYECWYGKPAVCVFPWGERVTQEEGEDYGDFQQRCEDKLEDDISI